MKRLSRTAGILSIAPVVMLLAGYSQQRSPLFGASPASIVRQYSALPGGRFYVGACLVTVAWLVLLAGLSLVARLLTGTTAASGWFSGLVSAAGATAVVVTLAGSYATAFAAYYAASHGYSADVVAGISMISKFADMIAIAACGVCAVAVGAAGLASGRLPRWAAWISIVVGVACVLSGSGPKQLDMGTLLWLAWLVMTGVVLLRGPSRRALSGAHVAAAGPELDVGRVGAEMS